jgi:hypothetical protein
MYKIISLFFIMFIAYPLSASTSLDCLEEAKMCEDGDEYLCALEMYRKVPSDCAERGYMRTADRLLERHADALVRIQQSLNAMDSSWVAIKDDLQFLKKALPHHPTVVALIREYEARVKKETAPLQAKVLTLARLGKCVQGRSLLKKIEKIDAEKAKETEERMDSICGRYTI